MKPKYEQLKKDILYEQGQIDIVVAAIKKLKSELEKNGITDIKKAALATYLMNFYNGIENIMKRVAKDYLRNMPKSEDWHKRLLQQSCALTGNKFTLFDTDIVDRLYAYLAFRHFFIHGYGFKLNWDKMKFLVEDIEGLWFDIKESIGNFS